MKRSRSIWKALVLIVPALLLGLGGGIVLDRQVLISRNPVPGIPEGAEAQFKLMGEAWKIIERNYVNQEAVEPQSLTYGAIDGMVETLGDVGHSRFLSPQMAERHQNYIEGEFEGIGAYVDARDGQVIIVAPLDNSPAQKAGLRPGYVIVRVNGEDVTEHSLTQVVRKIQGPAGTEVSITVRDPESDETRRVTVERAEIELDLVTWTRVPGTAVAHVRISSFGEGAGVELNEVLTEIQSRDVESIVLDLRNNPGGLLDSAVRVSSQFLDEGPVMLSKEAGGKPEPVPVEEGVKTVDLPLVLLVNEGTASAAEIVTGALQDADRATVIGQTTSGAGTVLHTFTLSDGSMMLLAVEEWLTPDGRVIWHRGLEPDIQTSQTPGVQPFLPRREEEMTPDTFRAYEDAPLHRAVALLTGEPESGRE